MRNVRYKAESLVACDAPTSGFSYCLEAIVGLLFSTTATIIILVWCPIEKPLMSTLTGKAFAKKRAGASTSSEACASQCTGAREALSDSRNSKTAFEQMLACCWPCPNHLKDHMFCEAATNGSVGKPASQRHPGA